MTKTQAHLLAIKARRAEQALREVFYALYGDTWNCDPAEAHARGIACGSAQAAEDAAFNIASWLHAHYGCPMPEQTLKPSGKD